MLCEYYKYLRYRLTLTSHSRVSNMHVCTFPMSIIYEFLACNGHDMANQINNTSHEFNKVKPDTGYQWHDYGQN